MGIVPVESLAGNYTNSSTAVGAIVTLTYLSGVVESFRDDLFIPIMKSIFPAEFKDIDIIVNETHIRVGLFLTKLLLWLIMVSFAILFL